MFTVFANKMDMLAASILVVIGFSIALIISTRKGTLDPIVCGCLIGSLLATPFFMYETTTTFGFSKEDSGTLLGWVMQLFVGWLLSCLPGGLVGIFFAAIVRRFGKGAERADTTLVRGQSLAAIVIILLAGAFLWVAPLIELILRQIKNSL